MNAPATLPRPWHRQLWPWLLIAIPLIGAIMACTTVFYAYRFADDDVRAPYAAPLEKTNWESPR